jgi:hypothetical protein
MAETITQLPIDRCKDWILHSFGVNYKVNANPVSYNIILAAICSLQQMF